MFHCNRVELVDKNAKRVLFLSREIMIDVFLREPNRTSALPVIGNGPPGTFVLFPNGLRVSLPTDQIVFADDTRGHARVGFGGMRFVGSEEGRLVFVRIRELFPEDQLSPDRSHTMLLDPQWVATISVDGRPVWAAGARSR